jgi:hypothetical protein
MPPKKRDRTASPSPTRVLPKRMKRGDIGDIARHFSSPSYDPTPNAKGGGVRASATLSPNSLAAIPTTANSSKPTAIVQARKKYPGSSFKAGHLLNGEFYGDGDDYKNLTILSATGNANHKKFDNRVKDAVRELKKFYELLIREYVDVSAMRYGIEVEIRVSDEKWGKNPPEKFICKRLNCTAKVVNLPKVSDLKDADGDVLSDAAKEAAQKHIDEIKKYVNQAKSNGQIENPE